jgi:hypothetical protein
MQWEEERGRHNAEKSGEIVMIAQKVGVVPRSLHAVAGAPLTARKKKPATPVGMTGLGVGRFFSGSGVG